MVQVQFVYFYNRFLYPCFENTRALSQFLWMSAWPVFRREQAAAIWAESSIVNVHAALKK